MLQRIIDWIPKRQDQYCRFLFVIYYVMQILVILPN